MLRRPFKPMTVALLRGGRQQRHLTAHRRNYRQSRLIFLIGAAAATADVTYDINFTATVGTVPTSGSFTYDGSAFTDFTVNWLGLGST